MSSLRDLLDIATTESLYVQIGNGDLSVRRIIDVLIPHQADFQNRYGIKRKNVSQSDSKFSVQLRCAIVLETSVSRVSKCN